MKNEPNATNERNEETKEREKIMIIPIPKRKPHRKQTFLCPEGNYRAKLEDVTAPPPKHNDEQKIRLLFETEVPTLPDEKVLTRKDFVPDMSEGSHLRRFLEQWKGREAFENLEKLDFDWLLGMEADLTIVLYDNPGYSTPYRDIQAAYPVGTLDLTDAEKAPSQNIQKQAFDLKFKEHKGVRPFEKPIVKRNPNFTISPFQPAEEKESASFGRSPE